MTSSIATLLPRVASEVRRAVGRRGAREVHFSYATFGMQEGARALQYALSPSTWRNDWVQRFCARFAEETGSKGAVALGSGRMALFALLKSLGIGRGDEVVVQGFTCVVVPAAVVHTGATPVYADIDARTLNMSVDTLDAAITPRCRAVIVQHTFGRPAPLEAIAAYARQRGLAVIEDCAHVAVTPFPDVATDGAFFSLELTKPMNVGLGGVATSSRADVLEGLEEQFASADSLSVAEIAQAAVQLGTSSALYRPAAYGLARLPLMALYRTGIFRPSSTRAELAGARPARYPSRLSPLHARLGLDQIARRRADDERRRRHAQLFTAHLQSRGWPVAVLDGQLPLLRYPLLVEDRTTATEIFARRGIELGHWFNAPLHPVGSADAVLGYREGSCPQGEWASEHCVNLPTHPSLSEGDVSGILGALDETLAVVRPAFQRAAHSSSEVVA